MISLYNMIVLLFPQAKTLTAVLQTLMLKEKFLHFAKAVGTSRTQQQSPEEPDEHLTSTLCF